MGVEFKLSDRELPASPAFITFLADILMGGRAGPEIWSDQTSEALLRWETGEPQRVAKAADFVMQSPRGRELVAKAYSVLVSLLTGDPQPLTALHSRFQFINVAGIPRTGGSYLTAELYRSIGMAPERVPSALAHDSFPEAGPFELTEGVNSWIVTLKTTAEYLVMVETFFADRAARSDGIVVPKKLTKGLYAAAFFQRVFGPHSSYLLTVRHPVAACISTYEKSGGLPEDRRPAVRSNIEEWCRRDLQHTGCGAEQFRTMDYFDAYLRYWEQYHMLVTTTGLSGAPNLRIIGYGSEALHSVAQQCHHLHGSNLRALPFRASCNATQRHPEWVQRARPAIERVRAAWRVVGLEFPMEEVIEYL